MKMQHPHPFYLLEVASRFLFLLLLPSLRWAADKVFGFSYGKGAVWWDLCLFGVVTGSSLLARKRFVFSFGESGITFQKGILLTVRRYLPYSVISCLSVTVPWYYAPFKVVRLQGYTDSKEKKADFAVTVSQKNARRLIAVYQKSGATAAETARPCQVGKAAVLLFALAMSSSLAGMLFLFAFLSGIRKLFGKELKDQLLQEIGNLKELPVFGLPPVLATVGYSILLGWGFSFLLNFFRYLQFSAVRNGTFLETYSGLFSPQHTFLSVRRLYGVTIRQSILAKLFGFYGVWIRHGGHHREHGDTGVLIPACTKKNLRMEMHRLLPEFPFVPSRLKPPKQALSRFLFLPVVCLLGGGAGVVLGRILFPVTAKWLPFFYLCWECFCGWWLLFRGSAFLHNGIGNETDYIILRYTRGFRFLTSSIPKRKISGIRLSQSPLQQRRGCCDLHFFLHGEVGHPIIVRELAQKEAEVFLLQQK